MKCKECVHYELCRDLFRSLTDLTDDDITCDYYEDRPSEETFEWCHDCKEYDKKNHCCHRWTKVIRDTVEELKQDRRLHGECNQCRYYDGVHGVQGHAPCWHWNIGGVMWNDYCSRFEKEGDENG